MPPTYLQVTDQSASKLEENVRFFNSTIWPEIGEDINHSAEPTRLAGDARFAMVDCLWGVSFLHFGFPLHADGKQLSQKGVELCEIYFSSIGNLIQQAQPEVKWFQPSVWGFMLASLAGAHYARTRFANWLVNQLSVEPLAIPEEPLHGDLLLVVASSMQSEPMDVRDQLSRLSNSRKKRPKLLLQAYYALRDDNPSEFTEAIIASTDRFVNSSACENNVLLDATAKLESVLVGLAWEKGWHDLDFPFETAARLITHRSVGIVP